VRQNPRTTRPVVATPRRVSRSTTVTGVPIGPCSTPSASACGPRSAT
jgi:hypothetical protein